MKQSLFTPRILLLATAFAAGAAVAGGTTSSAGTSSAAGADAHASAGASTPETAINSNTSVGASTAIGSSTSATAAVTPRNASGKALKPKSAADKFRTELRNCAQMTGAERDGCLARAIENRA